MTNSSDYKQGAQFFKVLSHPTRLFIVEKLLAKEKCVTDIQELVNVSQPKGKNIILFDG